MKIEIKRLNDGFNLEAANEEGNTIRFDAAPEIGGTGKGMRPMQALLSALGGCSSIDVIAILKKQRQPLKDIRITVTGEREKDVVPSVFREAHIHFQLFGNIDESQAQKAVTLAVEKYCSVGKTMESSARITHSFEIIRS
jgi:putative redox protein